MTRIELFDVRPADDDAFLAAWDDSGRDARLHRALRRDVAPRFVAIDGEDGDEYEVVYEAGDPDGPGGVAAIELYEVAEGDDDRFLGAWRPLRDLVAGRQGHLGLRLHRSSEPAHNRYVAVARWSSPLMVARAAAVPEIRAAREGLGFRSLAGLYEVLRG